MNEQLKSDLLKNEADEFWANCESKAAELEITVAVSYTHLTLPTKA